MTISLGFSFFVGSCIPKSPWHKNSSGTILPMVGGGGGIRRFIPFPKGISPKVNVVARQEFELTYNDISVQHVSHFAPVTHLEMTYLAERITWNYIRIIIIK